MARSPPLLPLTSSDASRGRPPYLPSPPLGAERVEVRWGWYYGACRAQIFMGRASRRTGSIPGGSCWSGYRVMPRSCG